MVTKEWEQICFYVLIPFKQNAFGYSHMQGYISRNKDGSLSFLPFFGQGSILKVSDPEKDLGIVDSRMWLSSVVLWAKKRTNALWYRDLDRELTLSLYMALVRPTVFWCPPFQKEKMDKVKSESALEKATKMMLCLKLERQWGMSALYLETWVQPGLTDKIFLGARNKEDEVAQAVSPGWGL